MPRITIPYRPRYPDVHRVLESRRFCVLVAHRRFGKTVLAVNHIIKMALGFGGEAGHFGYVAPYRNQAKSVAWDYLKHFTAPVPGRVVNESELSISLPCAGGRSRARIFGADNPDALRGLYFDGVVLDEVAQMKPSVWEEIIQPALADRGGWALFIGTPKGVNLFSELYHHALKEAAGGSRVWAAMSFPVDRTGALPAGEVARLREELSENKFRQEMLCDFTASADDSLITLDDVTAALERGHDPELAQAWPLAVGVDVARFGEDATVFFPRRGLQALAPLVLARKSNLEVAQRLAAYIAERKPAVVNIDQGQGTGVIDLARDLAGPGVIVNEVPFGGRALDERKFVNRRAEIWTRMRDWLRAGGALPKSGQLGALLRGELPAPVYSFDSRGRIRLEPKEEIKKRLKRSTDLGDALALTFAVDLPASIGAGQAGFGPGQAWRRARKDGELYDPFA